MFNLRKLAAIFGLTVGAAIVAAGCSSSSDDGSSGRAAAEVLATDAETGAPVLVRHRVGKGEAYLLCTHEFPGNSRLVSFMKLLLRSLAQSTPWPVELEDINGDIYYTVRWDEETGMQTIHLLNTDWTTPNNEKRCRFKLAEKWVNVMVREGRISIVNQLDELVILTDDDNLHAETIRPEDESFAVELHGYGNAEIKLCALEGGEISASFEGVDVPLQTQDGWKVAPITFGDRSVSELKLLIKDK